MLWLNSRQKWGIIGKEWEIVCWWKMKNQGAACRLPCCCFLGCWYITVCAFLSLFSHFLSLLFFSFSSFIWIPLLQPSKNLFAASLSFFSLKIDRQTDRWGRLIDICRQTKGHIELQHCAMKMDYTYYVIAGFPQWIGRDGIAIIMNNAFCCNTDCVYVCTQLNVWHQALMGVKINWI